MSRIALLKAACALAAALFLGACAQLLPGTQAEVSSPWRSFDEAKAAIEAIAPERTTAADLRVMGIDPYASTNVQLLSYSDILLRFPVVSTAQSRLDSGLRECLEAGKTCSGLYISVSDVKQDHVGPFWLDTLGFKRVVQTTGWNFNALVLLVDERVVYTLYGGQPNLHGQETRRQPLGPLQSFGDTLPIGALR